MSNAKFDLYNAEWLDLVFDHRNKEYGAYDLRKHYGSNMAKAMGVAFAVVGVLVIASIVFKPAIDNTVLIPVSLKEFKTIDPPPPPVKAELKKAEPPKSSEPLKATPPVPTTRFVTPVIVTTVPTEEPPVIKDITGAVGPQTVKAPGGGENAMDKADKGEGNGVAPADNGVVDGSSGLLEVMPEPVGGAAAWGKFLQRNLRYPPVAQENGASGRVFLSFIIEKNGELSNIKVDRGAGYGFDEEALRVLKLAKAWKPGIQNGQPVRVRYTIPINFQLNDQ